MKSASLFQNSIVATVLALCLILCTGAQAAPSSPQEGMDYRKLPIAQTTEHKDKIEVTEFFWYACPHCNAFEPSLHEWVKRQQKDVIFKRIPIAFNDSFIPQQRLFYALEAMNLVDVMHTRVFAAIHSDRNPLDSEKLIGDFVEKSGIDRSKFLQHYNSFGMQTKLSQAKKMMEAYKVDGVPMLAIDGRYVTSPSIAGGSQAAALQIADFLINKERAAKNTLGSKGDDKKVDGKLSHKPTLAHKTDGTGKPASKTN